MTGDLSEREIDLLLRSAIVARIGCTLPDGVVYVVPVTYAYDGTAIYSYAAEGMKLDAMRARPFVCVEVDRVEDASNWSSAIAWGTFSELDGEAASDALRALSERLRTMAIADGAAADAERSHVERLGRYGVIFRIDLHKKTGRYARSA